MNLEEFLARFEGEDLEFRTKFQNTEDKERDIRVITSFFNGRGGVLIFGITEDGTKRELVGLDLPPQVIETGLTNKLRGKCEPEMRPKISIVEVDGKHVVIVECPRGKLPPYKAAGKVYIRRNSTSIEAKEDEIADLYKQRTPEFDKEVLIATTKEDLDLDLLRSVLERRENQQILDGDLDKLLLRNGLAVEENGKVHLTLAGLLLFGKQPQHFLPHTRVLFQIPNATNPNEWEVIGAFEGNIFQQIDQVIAFLTNNLRKSARIVGFERIEELEIPTQALREAVINAVVHRDYHDTRAETQVSIDPSSVRIVSPGGLVAPLTIKEIEQGKFNPTTRNPVIAATLLTAGLMDKRGTGIPRMTTLTRGAGLPNPQIQELTGGAAFEVVFTRKQPTRLSINDNKISLPPEVIKELSDPERKILLHLERFKEIRPGVAEAAISLSRPKVNEILNSLVERKILKRVAQSKHDPQMRYELHERFLLSTTKKKSGDNQTMDLFGTLE
jgi:ATP-dependent DNA helicase RecG